jgi:hypothetical protein
VCTSFPLHDGDDFHPSARHFLGSQILSAGNAATILAKFIAAG